MAMVSPLISFQKAWAEILTISPIFDVC